jgi:cobalt-zinc-cadmium efflux system protein
MTEASRAHSHDHAAAAKSLSNARLLAAIAVNVILSAVQVVAGVFSGSLSLVADALHNLNDAGALLVALVARRTGRRPADKDRTFGYRRMELLGALVNATALVLVSLYLASEAVLRFFEPREVAGWPMVVVAAIAFVVDSLTALLTYSMSRGSLNVKAAFVHNVTDALGSLAVMVAGILIILYDFRRADVVATLLLAGYAMYQGVSIARKSAGILTQATPGDIDLDKLVTSLLSVDKVLDVHHVHLWEMDESTRSFESHIVVDTDDLSQAVSVKEAIRTLLRQHDIHHSTLELEFGKADGECKEGEVIAPH